MFFFISYKYSNGLPVIYVIGLLYFSLAYFINKLMLIKFYSKTNEFNEDLPLRTMKIAKVAVVAHMASSFVVTMVTLEKLKYYGTSENF